jgi:hypothetical protein
MFPFHKPVSLPEPVFHLGRVVARFNVKPGVFQSLREILSIYSHMIDLSKAPQSLLGRYRGEILEGRRARVINRHEGYAPPAGLEHAVQFAHRRAVVHNVFENVVAYKRIENAVAEREARDVEFRIRKPGRKIDGNVPDVALFPERFPEKIFGREMKQPYGAPKKRGRMMQVMPQKPVPALRGAIGTYIVVVGRIALVPSNKRIKIPVAARAINAISPVSQRDAPSKHLTQHVAFTRGNNALDEWCNGSYHTTYMGALDCIARA